jgi:hypothetical protein
VVVLRHGGCYRYAFRLGRTRISRTAVRIGLPAGPSPKAIDDTSWREATHWPPLRFRVARRRRCCERHVDPAVSGADRTVLLAACVLPA